MDATTGIKKVKKRISPPPIFKGDKGERPEAHLLRAKDWFDSSGIVRNQDKVYNFKHTLDSKAREWYADLINKATIPPRWPELETAFSRYFSTQGRSIKHLHDSWRKMSFNPDTDDIEEFVRDAQECAKQLEYDDHVIINMIKSVMPREIYGTLYYMDDLAEVINFCKDYFSKNPRDQKDEASTAPDKGASALTPFSKMTSSAQPLDFQQSLTQLTENLYKLDFNQKPYKPTIYPQGRGRGRGREMEDSKVEVEDRDPISPIIHKEEAEEEVDSEEDLEVDKSLTKAPQKETPEKILRLKMLTEIDADIAEKLDIGLRTAHRRKEMMRRPQKEQQEHFLISVKLHKISMALQMFSMESQIFTRKIKKSRKAPRKQKLRTPYHL